MRSIDIPHTTFHPDEGLATLEELCTYPTEITGYLAASEKVTLAEDGWIWVRKGYVFDYGSGPAIDDPAMVYASLIHDALYELMQAGQLPWSERKKADQLLRKMLRHAGASKLRAWYVYHAVRIGYPVMQAFRSDKDKQAV